MPFCPYIRDKKSWIRNTGSTASFCWEAGNWMEFRYLQYLAGWGRGLVLSTSHSCFWKSVWPNILHSSGIPRLFFGWRKKPSFSPGSFWFRILIFRFSIQNISFGPGTTQEPSLYCTDDWAANSKTILKPKTTKKPSSIFVQKWTQMG